MSDKNILLGKPTIKGIRLSVEFIIERLARGWTQEQLLENYPRLSREDCSRFSLMWRNVSRTV